MISASRSLLRAESTSQSMPILRSAPARTSLSSTVLVTIRQGCPRPCACRTSETICETCVSLSGAKLSGRSRRMLRLCGAITRTGT